MQVSKLVRALQLSAANCYSNARARHALECLYEIMTNSPAINTKVAYKITYGLVNNAAALAMS
jgi:hypothetical protein